MEFTVNFYTVSGEGSDELKKFHSQVRSENPMYSTLETGDIIVPKNDGLEYVIVRIVKDLYREELNVYMTGVKSKEEIMDEIEDLANKTVKSVLESIRDTLDFDENKDLNKN